MSAPAKAASLQDLSHPADHDYALGSPHLTHASLREMILRHVRDAVAERFASGVRPRVLEIGAGHGAFTDHTLAMGGHVTITEMSQASADLLARRYAGNPHATVLFDPTGQGADLNLRSFDVVMCVSVLHHIPDYLAAIAAWSELLAAGGTFVSFQDPLWYPRRSRASLGIDRAAFYAWRLGQGDLIDGLRSVGRRWRGRMDETNARDMVEFHVLRQGCDEAAIAAQLQATFESVSVTSYWSTPSPSLQRAGQRLGATSAFGVVARGRR